MKFDELPPGWTHSPMTDPELACGVLDLMTDVSQRKNGCLTVLLCTAEGLLLQPIVLYDVPEELSPALKAMTVERVMEVIGDPSWDKRLAVVVGIGSPRLAASGEDHEWAHLIKTHAAAMNVALLGTYTMGPQSTQLLPD